MPESAETTYPTEWKPCTCGRPGTPPHQRRMTAHNVIECGPVTDEPKLAAKTKSGASTKK